ncbi:MAG: hypothetical protein DRR00_30390 [Candidatus Parabeggiatoa sp. nov. 3]|nr:MAG: hypothetical protein DRR00_30390 [Gammaproteobacteria bacterium]RKZ55624.1 MAG: hypothetical protein DRQ99_29730 [Gammaproteobacteria bacterium]
MQTTEKFNQSNKDNKGILLLTPFFSPNIGGVETHFDDLVSALDKRGYNVFVQTYSPITTENTKWLPNEKRGQNIFIRRYRWFGKTLFHKLEKYPVLDFLYLTPYLFIRVLFFLIFNHHKIDVIHAQGFNASLIAIVLKKVFKKKVVASTHAVYELDKASSTAKLIKTILDRVDKVLCLSNASANELVTFGVKPDRIENYKYWIDLESFKPLGHQKLLRQELSLSDSFSVLYVGRLIEKKGITILVEVAKQLPEIQFIFIGVGPLAAELNQAEQAIKNVRFLGKIANVDLPKYYNIADIFCIPSQYEEGYGRVVLEAVACGVPVIGSDKGGIPEALDQTVSILVEPTKGNLKSAISELHLDKPKYQELADNCRQYAEMNFSDKNVETIIESYHEKL